MSLSFKTFDSLEKVLQAVPRTIEENIDFRIDLHTMLEKDKSLQNLFLTMCLEVPQLAFDSIFWTYNPQQEVGKMNVPFILRPKQIEAVNKLHRCILEQRDAGINKSRKMGASEICAKLAALHAITRPGTVGIFGSRKKEYVDNKGDPTTLFAKIDHAFNYLPGWLKSQLHIERKDMQLNVLDTDATLIGETTNESFSAGSRGTFMVLDEFGRVLKRAADSIEGSIHDVANCVIYSSTHWYGVGHTFNEALQKPTTEVIGLIWYESPDEAKFLYTSPQPGFVELLDIESYQESYPELFKYGKFINVNDLPEKHKKLFVADGGTHIPQNFRSPWHDERERKSKGNKRDFLCNVWATPVGSSDSVFDQQVLLNIKGKLIREPDYEGEVLVDGEFPEFWDNYGLKRLKWWGKLDNLVDNPGCGPFYRPDQKHNYIIGCDPSFGLGSSNSVAGILDVNTRTLVGLWSCANTKEDAFANQVVTLAKWVGGVEDAYIIWENNGANGKNFGERIISQEWYNVYTQTIEDAKFRKKQRKYGWRSNTRTKGLLLGDLSIALSSDKPVIIHSQDVLDELFDYIYLEGGDLSLSSKADLTTGARERHGDRVIAVALCVLGMKEQMEGNFKEQSTPPPNSFMARYKAWEKEEQKKKQYERKFLY